MRAIFFNIWHGHELNNLKIFLNQQKKQTDIFCFVETNSDLNLQLERVLPDFNVVFNKGGLINFSGGIYDGQSVFVKKHLNLFSSGYVELYKPTNKDASGLLLVDIGFNNKLFSVGCIHGTARPGNKLDTLERVNQSKIIIDTFNNKETGRIIGGDFNLMPDTKSIRMFEQSGYKNLIKDFGIQNTRNKLCWDQYPDEVAKFGKQYFADYCFVSKNVNVKNFEVPNIEVSDHEPLILDFEI